jgi:hypothetical protein
LSLLGSWRTVGGPAARGALHHPDQRAPAAGTSRRGRTPAISTGEAGLFLGAEARTPVVLSGLPGGALLGLLGFGPETAAA